MGRWQATRIVPPALTGPDAGAEVGPVLAPDVAAELALGLGVAAPPQAAMTAAIEVIERPTRVPRWMNSRRVMRSLA